MNRNYCYYCGELCPVCNKELEIDNHCFNCSWDATEYWELSKFGNDQPLDYLINYGDGDIFKDVKSNIVRQPFPIVWNNNYIKGGGKW